MFKLIDARIFKRENYRNASHKDIDSNLEKSVNILNQENFNSAEYNLAVEKWEDDIAIWPYLFTKKSRINLVEYIRKNDDICEQPYDPEVHKCSWFELNLYLRYQNGPEPEILCQAISEHDLIMERAPEKLKIPIHKARYDKYPVGHGFNAILIEEGDKSNADNYYFIEPQRRQGTINLPNDVIVETTQISYQGCNSWMPFNEHKWFYNEKTGFVPLNTGQNNIIWSFVHQDFDFSAESMEKHFKQENVTKEEALKLDYLISTMELKNTPKFEKLYGIFRESLGLD